MLRKQINADEGQLQLFQRGAVVLLLVGGNQKELLITAVVTSNAKFSHIEITFKVDGKMQTDASSGDKS